MIRAGEASGALPEVMDRLIYIMEHEYKIRTDIRSALQYPIFVIPFLGLAFFVLLTYVIPQFANIFERSGLTLPLLTRICILHTRFLTAYGPLWPWPPRRRRSLRLLPQNERRAPVNDTWLLRLPLLGTLFRKPPSRALRASFPFCSRAAWTSWMPWTSCPAPSATRPSPGSSEI